MWEKHALKEVRVIFRERIVGETYPELHNNFPISQRHYTEFIYLNILVDGFVRTTSTDNPIQRNIFTKQICYITATSFDKLVEIIAESLYYWVPTSLLTLYRWDEAGTQGS